MIVTFERSGGFAGFKDVLRLDPGQLSLSRRNQPETQRALSPEESKALGTLLPTALATPLPVAAAAGRRIPDAFTYTLTVGGQTISLFQPRAPESSEGPWQALMAWLDGILADEISRQG